MFNYRLSDLPGFGKLFVAIFTALMLFVTLWAAFIYYVDEGVVDTNHLPAYLTQDNSQPADSSDFPQDVEDITDDDSSAVLAPIWDTTMKGQEVNLDTASPEESSTVKKAIGEQESGDRTIDMSGYDGDKDDETPDQLTHLRRNVGLAHTHINGQTLLFFALGAIFLFSSAPPRTKKYVYWIFGIAVLGHNIGLTGWGFYSIFDDLLSISGVTLLVVIIYMSFLIFIDLAKSGGDASAETERPKAKD
jgi:hypothetical protein